MKTIYLLFLVVTTAFCGVPEVLNKSGTAGTQVIHFPRLAAGATYSLLFSVDAPVDVELRDGTRTLIQKKLATGDMDVYAPFHLNAAAAPELHLTASGPAGRYLLRVNRWPDSPSLSRGANHTWQDASPMVLGQTVFASGDEADYIKPAGWDWYRFEFKSTEPKLVFFQLELMDRDFLPVDVSVFRVNQDKLEEYVDGQDPVSVPHEVQALPGNKFAPRILRDSGTYYVRVRANHPEYKLRTRLYDVPAYSDPHTAVRTAIDYMLGAGDSWFANTPRRGGILSRADSLHQETSLCVGCHPSHFSQRAQLYAAQKGYPVVQRAQLQFLAERFYNNPRPFYGFEEEGAVWSRVISAPANVLGRMSVLTNLYEEQVSQEPRPAYHTGIAKYLDLYYAGRTELPPDETNGNTPLVSTFEVAWYAWKTTHDPKLPDMIVKGTVKNMIDLCYQTQAMADIDAAQYKDQIQKNAERILSLQRPDGQWSMRFDPKEAEVEFQTGHALWALASAGVPRENPQVTKGLQYLLGRQQPFGGWMDPFQSFENFKTPFRESQFAVLALSAYYPGDGKGPAIAQKTLSQDPVRMLDELDRVWDSASPALVHQIETAAESNDALIRQAAAEALGRLTSSLPVLVRLLGDPSKMVQRTAAWGVRQIYSRRDGMDDQPLLRALSSPDVRTRWGATRVFAHHFAALAVRDDLVAALDKLVADPVVPVRLQAIQALWQSWFWNAKPALRSRIEDTVLAALAQPQHPWVEANLHAAVYNLADENIRYLYNNWVPLLGRDADRERAIRGRLAVESQLASKFAAVLRDGPDAQKKELLSALAEFPLRRGDVYDPNADATKPSTVYSRIGNDIEQIAFFGSSANTLSEALAPLANSPDPEMKGLANRAALVVRDTPFTQVASLAGERGNLLRQKNESPGPGAPRPPAPVISKATPNLDKDYFDAHIAPIMRAKGADGYACVDCHVTHTLFNAKWPSVLNVVDTANPENSLVLRKPTSTAETEGVAGSRKLAHGGGKRWNPDSPEYETILKWIQGRIN